MISEAKVISCGLLLVLASGCATNRGVLDVEELESSNPASGDAVSFVRIVDVRDFQIDPSQPSTPSLKNDEIDDDAITLRAIARKRNGYGKALGDILLPEGKTVIDVVENRLALAFRNSGYRVVADDSAEDRVIPIEVRIEKFWGWMNPGFWSIGLSFESAIVVIAPVVGFEEGLRFESEVERRFQTAMGSNWQTVIDASLEALSRDMLQELEDVGPGSD